MTVPTVIKGALLTPFVGVLTIRTDVPMFWMADTRYSWMAPFPRPPHAGSKP